MSIAARIESINDNLKNAYESLDGLGIDLTNTDKNLENLSSKIDTLYNEFPQITEEGTEITLNNTKNARLKMILKGNTEQANYTGKNLLPSDASTQTLNDVVITKNNDGSYTLTGTASVLTAVKIGDIQIENGKTYTMSSGNSDDSSNSYRIDGRKTAGSIYNNWNTSSKPTLTATEDITIGIYIRIANGYNCNNVKIYPQVEEGSTATDYEQYVGGVPAPNPDYPQPIHVVTGNNTVKINGKNLFDINGTVVPGVSPLNKYNNGFILTKASNRTVKFELDAEAPAGTYTISYDTINYVYTGTRNAFFVSLQDAQNNNIVNNVILNDTGAIITAPDGFKRLYFFISSSQGDEATITIDNVQLEQGSTATDFEPYYHQDYPVNLGSLELCKIGNYQDYLYKKNGNWYKYGIIDKLILNGTENWSSMGWTSPRKAYRTEINNIKQTLNISDTSYVISDYYISYNQENLTQLENKYGIANRKEESQIIIRNDDYITSQEFKNFLASKNTIIYYVLNTPTSTQITNETLIAQLNAIEKAKSNEGQTNITQINANLPFIINATALLKNDQY